MCSYQTCPGQIFSTIRTFILQIYLITFNMYADSWFTWGLRRTYVLFTADYDKHHATSPFSLDHHLVDIAQAPNVFYATSSHNNLQLFSQWNSIVRVKSMNHGLINFIDTKAKCRNLKKLTCRGTLRQVFINQSLLTGDTISHVGIFDPALWTVAPLTFSLVQLSSPPSLTCVNKYTVYTYTVWKQG